MARHPRGKTLAKHPDPKNKRVGVQHMLEETGLLERLVRTGESYLEMQRLAERWTGYEIGRGSLKYAIDNNPGIARLYASACAYRQENREKAAQAARAHELKELVRQHKSISGQQRKLRDLETRLDECRAKLEEDLPTRAMFAYRERYSRSYIPAKKLYRIFKEIYIGTYGHKIAARTGISRASAFKIMRRMLDVCREKGIPLPSRRNFLTDEQRNRIEYLVPRIGYTYAARLLQLSYDRVKKYADSRGLRSAFRGCPNARMRRRISTHLRKAY